MKGNQFKELQFFGGGLKTNPEASFQNQEPDNTGSYLLVIWKVQVVITTSKEIPSVVGGVLTTSKILCNISKNETLALANVSLFEMPCVIF